MDLGYERVVSPGLSIFGKYSEPELVVQLQSVSGLLDRHPEILALVAKDSVDDSAS